MRPASDLTAPQWWWARGLSNGCSTVTGWEVVLVAPGVPGRGPWVESVHFPRSTLYLDLLPATVEWRGPLEVPCSR